MHDWFVSHFGPSIAPFSSVNILGRPTRFGGACAPRFSIDNGSTQYCEATLARDGVQTVTPAVPDPDLGREGLRAKTCREALLTAGSAERIYHALRLLPEYRQKSDLELRTALGESPIPSESQLALMYKLFYGYRQASSAILDDLRELAVAANSSSITVVKPQVYLDRRHEPWRYVLLGLCYGADTQFL